MTGLQSASSLAMRDFVSHVKNFLTAIENLAATTGAQRPTGPEMVKMAVDWEYERRRNNKLHRLRRHAGLAQPAADIADIKALPGRNRG